MQTGPDSVHSNIAPVAPAPVPACSTDIDLSRLTAPPAEHAAVPASPTCARELIEAEWEIKLRPKEIRAVFFPVMNKVLNASIDEKRELRPLRDRFHQIITHCDGKPVDLRTLVGAAVEARPELAAAETIKTIFDQCCSRITKSDLERLGTFDNKNVFDPQPEWRRNRSLRRLDSTGDELRLVVSRNLGTGLREHLAQLKAGTAHPVFIDKFGLQEEMLALTNGKINWKRIVRETGSFTATGVVAVFALYKSLTMGLLPHHPAAGVATGAFVGGMLALATRTIANLVLDKCLYGESLPQEAPRRALRIPADADSLSDHNLQKYIAEVRQLGMEPELPYAGAQRGSPGFSTYFLKLRSGANRPTADIPRAETQRSPE